MRRDAVRQLRTVAGHQAAATPQEEAAGIGGGQEAKARHSADAARERVVLLNNVVRNDRRRLGLRAPVPRAALRRSGRVHVAGRLRAGAGAVHHGAPRTVGRPVQLHVELVSRGMHQRRVQLQSHLRDVPDHGVCGGGRWCSCKRRPRRWRRRRWRWCRWRQRRRSHHQRGRAAGQHQGLRVSTRGGLRQLHAVVRRARSHVPVPLLAAQSHAGRGGLRRAAAVRRHRALFRGAVHHLRRHVHRAVRHALRLSVGRGRATNRTVQEFCRTLAHRRIQRSLDKHSSRTTRRGDNGSVPGAARRTERIMTILGDELLSTRNSTYEQQPVDDDVIALLMKRQVSVHDDFLADDAQSR